MPSVIIADDHPAFNTGLGIILGHIGCQVVTHTENGEDTLRALAELRPRIAFIDYQMPDKSGLQVIREATLAGLPTACVLMSGDFDVNLVESAMSAGAKGVMLKTANQMRLQLCVQTLLEGEVFIGPAVQQVLIQRLGHPPGTLPLLTGRENDVLLLTAEGLTAPQIATQLIVEQATVKKHLQHIYRKLEVTSKVGAVRKALDLGIITDRRQNDRGDRRDD